MRVLVCDDDIDVGGFLRTLFDLEGWSCELVTSGEECLERMASPDWPDVLVLDQVMPGLTGISVADRLRKKGFADPIILCSGHLGPELNDEIDRLALVPVNKIDLQALVRIVHLAVESPPVMAKPAPRARKKPPAKAPAKKAPAKAKAAAKKAPVKAKAPAKNAPAKKAPVTAKAPAKSGGKARPAPGRAAQ